MPAYWVELWKCLDSKLHGYVDINDVASTERNQVSAQSPLCLLPCARFILTSSLLHWSGAYTQTAPSGSDNVGLSNNINRFVVNKEIYMQAEI